MKLRSTSHLPVLIVFVAGTLAGCSPDEPAGSRTAGSAADFTPAEVVGTEVAQEYSPDLGIDLARMERLTSGLYREEVQVGDGQFATSGDSVMVHYTGWFPDGREFDSSQGSQPFDFELGRGQVIQGWDEGVAGMREGGRRRLVIPPDLAYGAEGVPGAIPPNSTLVFDVELLEVR